MGVAGPAKAVTSGPLVHQSMAFASTNSGRRLLQPADSAILELFADGSCIAANEALGASEQLAVPWPAEEVASGATAIRFFIRGPGCTLNKLMECLSGVGGCSNGH